VNVKRDPVQWLSLVLLGIILAGLSGCATNDPENASVRPWNAPQGWENGLPIEMQQQRR
jgi:type IV pilus biogenesis protein CpaD/CtpE